MKPLRMFLLLLFLFPAGSSATPFPRVTGPCRLVLPADHFPHPDFRTEWWYWTGNLEGENGRPFGFQLTFFRSRLVPPSNGNLPEKASPWRTRQVWMGHLAVSDIRGARHEGFDRLHRGAVGLAGADGGAHGVRLRVGDWVGLLEEGRQVLSAAREGVGIDLVLVPRKPPVFHGEDGYSRKGSRPEQASCYYSFTRLAATGELRMGGEVFRVRGTAWMDHEFTSEPLDSESMGWDWFSVQLDDGWDFMAFFIRKKNGALHPASSGTLVDPAGKSRSIPLEDMALTPLTTWKSPHTKARYPASWKLRIPKHGLDITLESRLADQEMIPKNVPAGVTYWEGSIAVNGRHQDREVHGTGYGELTGYAGSVADRL